MTRPRLVLLLALGISILVVGVAFALRSDRVGETVAPPAVVQTPMSEPVGMTIEEQQFYDQVSPLFRALAAESEAVAQLGESRSRNIFELQTRANRLTEGMQEIDAVLKTVPIPARFAESVATYRLAEAEIQTSMDNAIEAFSSFDFSSLGTAVAGFGTGADTLATATQQLDSAAGVGQQDATIAR